MKPVIEVEGAVVFHGSNLDVLPTLPDNSVDSIVTDPPYELGFMGKKWDSTGIAYSVELWRECLRVLKPGGHLLSFGGTRTWHRVAVAIEDAGFEVRDSIAWMYGSGFPKSLDISKAIDKASGAQREVIGTHNGSGMTKSNVEQGAQIRNVTEWNKYSDEPVTPDAEKWSGWGTALKPAFEPVVVARKPLIGTVAENVLEWGVGGLNIDSSRIPGEVPSVPMAEWSQSGTTGASTKRSGEMSQPHTAGRWPANVMLDEYAAGLLDEQSGVLKSGSLQPGRTVKETNVNFNQGLTEKTWAGEANSGGASRFFYVAKASKRDRNEGLDGLPTKTATELTGRKEGSKGLSGSVEHGNSTNPFANGGSVEPRANFHPTVKPTDLMRYLIKLVTPEGGTVLDPFTGSGSTGKAALLDGFKFIGIELTDDYLPIIAGRLQYAADTRNAQQTVDQIAEQETLFSLENE